MKKYKIPLEEILAGIEEFVLNGNRGNVVIKGDLEERKLFVEELEKREIPYILSSEFFKKDYEIDLTQIKIIYQAL